MVETLKEFDWEFASKIHSPKKVEFWRANYNKPTMAEEYVAAMQLHRENSTRPGRHNPSLLRQEFRNLQKKFGFFK